MKLADKIKAAVFLDRDGTILNERGYLSDPKKMVFYKSAFVGLKNLIHHGFKLVVITNQSGVGRGLLSLKRLEEIHRVFKKRLIAKGVKLSGIYFCPHLPEKGCPCRKPKPGMALKAKRDLDLDLKKSFVIGDQQRDMELAQRIGAKGILVLTGAGRSNKSKAAKHLSIVARDLLSASRWILSEVGGK